MLSASIPRTMAWRMFDLPSLFGPTRTVNSPKGNLSAFRMLRKFVTESGKILPRRVTGMSAFLHRKITREIKRSRSVLLMK